MTSKLPAGLVGLSLALLVSACGGTGAKQTAEAESIPTTIELVEGFNPDAHFRWATIQFASSWDPTKSIGGGDLPMYRPVYDRLLDMDATGELQPMLATDWDVAEDNSSVTLTLRSGLTFSDGTPFDAEAVKFSLERNASETSSLRNESAPFASAEVLDPQTIKINVKYGLGSYMTALTVRSGIVVSPTAVQSGALAQGPVGVGPYVTTEIVPGERAEFERTPGYWEPQAQNVATMSFRLMTDDQTRLNALDSGEVDGIYLQPTQIDSALQMDLNVVSAPATNFFYLAVNADKAPFDDPKARVALNHALDREEIAEGLYDGHCTPGIQPFPESSFAYNTEIGDGSDIWPHDPQKAKDLLADAGVTGDVEIQLLAPNPTMFVQLAEVVQAQLADVGITAKVKSVPAAQLTQEFAIDQTVEAATLPYVGTPDPSGATAYFMPGHPYNVGQAASQETIDLATAAAGPVDMAERHEIYQDVVQSMIDTPTQIMPICQMHLAAAYSPDVSNVEQLPYDAPTQRGVAIKD